MGSLIVGGVERNLGCLPRELPLGDPAGFPLLSDDFLIDRKHWSLYKNHSLRPFARHVIDQASQSSCCGCASVGAIMICREFAGLNKIALSQAVPYGMGNGGSDSGMAIDTGLRMIQKYGTCPVDVVDQYDWRGRDWPSNWEEIAARYRGIEAHDCPTFNHAVSAVLRGFPVVYGAKGHAVVLIDMNRNVLNSWGSDWGDDGFGVWANESEMKYGIERQYGAFALRVAVDPSDDTDLGA